MRLWWPIPVAVLALSLSACRTFYVFPPVEVTTESVSPTYRLTIRNGLSEQLTVEPVEGARIEPIELAPGETAEFALAIKRLKVGGSRVPQVVENDFIEVESAGFGSIDLVGDEPDCPGCRSCSLRVDIRHPDWFTAQRRSENVAPAVAVCIAACTDGRVVFRQGPATPEC